MATPKKIGTHTTISARLVHPKDLILNPDNERIYNADHPAMVQLRQSIAAQGILNPLEIYDDGTVSNGNRRLFNIRILMEQGVDIGPVPTRIIERPATKVDEVLHRLNINEAEQFSPLEQALAFSKLRAEGLSNADIAKRSPFTAMHIGNMLTLYDMSAESKALVQEGKISATLAVEAVRKYGEDILAKAVAHALSQGRDRATQRNVDAVAPVAEAEAAPAPAAPAPATSATSSSDAAPVAEAPPFEVDAEPVATADAEPVATADAEPVVDAEPATAEVDVNSLSDAQPAAPTPTSVEVLAGGEAPSTNNVATFTAKALIQMVAPTLSTLFEAIEGGTVSEKIEALTEAKEDLALFLTQAKRLGLFD